MQDVARGICGAIGQPRFSIFNLSGDQLISLQDIISAAAAILGTTVEVVEMNPAAVNIRNPLPDKARGQFGWKSEIDLAAGLHTLILDTDV